MSGICKIKKSFAIHIGIPGQIKIRKSAHGEIAEILPLLSGRTIKKSLLSTDFNGVTAYLPDLYHF